MGDQQDCCFRPDRESIGLVIPGLIGNPYFLEHEAALAKVRRLFCAVGLWVTAKFSRFDTL
jgi:hypothetical protein